MINSSTQRALEHLKNYSFLLVSQSVVGTAFRISETLFLTNYHVIEGHQDDDFRMLHPSLQQSVPISITTKQSSEKDLAVMKIEESVIQHLPKYSGLPNTAGVMMGATVFWLGYPQVPGEQNRRLRFGNGTIASTDLLDESEFTRFEINGNLTNGNSGSPVYIMDGNEIKIVGLVRAKMGGLTLPTIYTDPELVQIIRVALQAAMKPVMSSNAPIPEGWIGPFETNDVLIQSLVKVLSESYENILQEPAFRKIRNIRELLEFKIHKNKKIVMAFPPTMLQVLSTAYFARVLAQSNQVIDQTYQMGLGAAISIKEIIAFLES